MADINLGFGLWLKDQKIRLARVNSEETLLEDKSINPVAIEQRQKLHSLLEGREIYFITQGKKEKFGRWIGEILIDNKGTVLNCSDCLLEAGIKKY